LLYEFAEETHDAWQRLLGAGGSLRVRAGADPWVQQRAARMVACIPASGEELEPLLAQTGLSARRDTELGA
jgi:hypothetical protein